MTDGTEGHARLWASTKTLVFMLGEEGGKRGQLCILKEPGTEEP